MCSLMFLDERWWQKTKPAAISLKAFPSSEHLSQLLAGDMSAQSISPAVVCSVQAQPLLVSQVCYGHTGSRSASLQKEKAQDQNAEKQVGRLRSVEWGFGG